MKTFKQHVKEGSDKTAAAVGSQTTNSVEDSALGPHNIQDPDVLKRVNAFVGSIAEREYMRPQFAIDELKENEFKTLYTSDKEEEKTFVKEIQIDTDLELLIPDDYVNSISERLTLYNRLNELKTAEELTQFQTDLEDRFGPLPVQVEDLLNSVKLKWKAIGIGLERLILKKGLLSGYFIADQESKFYQSEVFSHVLQWVQTSAGKVELKEKQTRQGLRLRLAIQSVESISEALNRLADL